MVSAPENPNLVSVSPVWTIQSSTLIFELPLNAPIKLVAVIVPLTCSLVLGLEVPN